MTPRERVQIAYSLNEPDRVPICIGGTAQKFSSTVYHRLKERLGITDSHPKEQELDELGNVIYYHPKVLDFLGSDFRHVQIRRLPPVRTFENGSCEHELGFALKVSSNGEIVNIVTHPLSDATLGTLDRFRWPDPFDPRRYDGLRKETQTMRSESPCAIAVYKATLLGVFDLCCILRGMDKFLMDLIIDVKFAEALLEKSFEYNYAVYETLLKEVGDFVDVVEFNDDLGTQENLLISPSLYRKLVKPRHKRLVEMFKRAAPSAKVLIHCCGSIYDIIPDFIEIGIDVLNPIQPNAKKMDTYALKKEFGRDVCFQGGIDLQKAMVGSAEDVKNEVKKRIESMAPGGGYVLASSNNIGSDIPTENVMTLFACAKELGGYPIHF